MVGSGPVVDRFFLLISFLTNRNTLDQAKTETILVFGFYKSRKRKLNCMHGFAFCSAFARNSENYGCVKPN
jgi:hypothetical protein